MNMHPTCPDCGGPVAGGAPCPACLLGVGLESLSRDRTFETAWVPPTVAELAGRFPELELLELIGRGGMGAVYKARQKALNRLVAVKILPPEIGTKPTFAERFAREAQALARLSHPNIVTIHDFGVRDGLCFFVMEFVDGVNLRQLLDTARVSPREALAIVPQICDALQCAHDQGIVHRDIKPENLLLDRQGRVKIADFGLAKLVADAESAPADQGFQTRPNATVAAVGTPAYMAPEQRAHPEAVDPRADIYALGVVFYQMLTGELPGESLVVPPSQRVQIDVRLDEIVLRALERNPDLRYRQASEVKTQMELVVALEKTKAVAEARFKPTTPTPPPRSMDPQPEIKSETTKPSPYLPSPWLFLAPLLLLPFPLFILAKYGKAVPLTKGYEAWIYVILEKDPQLQGWAWTSLLAIVVCGTLAIWQIRRKPELFYGLKAALFETLLLPLLALDLWIYQGARPLTDWLATSTQLNPFEIHYLAFSGMAIACLATNLPIILGSWLLLRPPRPPAPPRRRWALPAMGLALAAAVAGFFLLDPKGLYPEIELGKLKYPIAKKNLDTPQKVMEAFLWCSIVGDLDGLSELFWVPQESDRQKLKQHLRLIKTQCAIRHLQDLRELADYPGFYVADNDQGSQLFQPSFEIVAGRYYLRDNSLARLGIVFPPERPGNPALATPPGLCQELTLAALEAATTSLDNKNRSTPPFFFWAAKVTDDYTLVWRLRAGGLLEQFVVGQETTQDPDFLKTMSPEELFQKCRYAVSHPAPLVMVPAGPKEFVAVACVSQAGRSSAQPKKQFFDGKFNRWTPQDSQNRCLPDGVPVELVDFQKICRSQFTVDGDTFQWQLPGDTPPLVFHRLQIPPLRDRAHRFLHLTMPRSLGVACNLVPGIPRAPLTLSLSEDDNDGKGILSLMVLGPTSVILRRTVPYEPFTCDDTTSSAATWVMDRHGESAWHLPKLGPHSLHCPGLAPEMLSGNTQESNESEDTVLQTNSIRLISTSGRSMTENTRWESLWEDLDGPQGSHSRLPRHIFRWPGRLKNGYLGNKVAFLPIPELLSDDNSEASTYYYCNPEKRDPEPRIPQQDTISVPIKLGDISLFIRPRIYQFIGDQLRHNLPATWEAIWDQEDYLYPAWGDVKISVSVNGKPLKLSPSGEEWYAPPRTKPSGPRGMLIVKASHELPGGVPTGGFRSREFPIEPLLEGITLPEVDIVRERLTFRLSFAPPQQLDPPPYKNRARELGYGKPSATDWGKEPAIGDVLGAIPDPVLPKRVETGPIPLPLVLRTPAELQKFVETQKARVKKARLEQQAEAAKEQLNP